MGTNLLTDKEHTDKSYLYSSANASLGWATWRRVWQRFDLGKKYSFVEMKKIVDKTFDSWIIKRHYLFRNTILNINKIDGWDFQFAYSLLNHEQIGITTRKNLVSNIGFDSEGTHTSNPQSPMANLPVSPILPLVYDDSKERNKEFEKDYFMRFSYKKGYRYIISLLYYLFFVKTKKMKMPEKRSKIER